MSNIERVGAILKQLFASFTHAKVGNDTVAQYMRLLQDIPLDDLQSIVDQCVVDCKFLPTIAEIRDRWHDLSRDPDELTAADAWALVQRAVKETGSFGIVVWDENDRPQHLKTPNFRDERINRCVRAIGWDVLCASDNGMADRAHFLKMFQELTARQERERKLLPASRQLIERKQRERQETLPGTGLRFLTQEDNNANNK